jgi:Ca2+-binding RTX toxin-like protein
MLRRMILMLTLAAIAAALLALGAGGAPAAVKSTNSGDINCADQKGNVCQGTGGNDTIIGTAGNDNISPGFGDDTVYAYGGNDEVRHSGGADTIEGGLGADTLRGGFGKDKIYDNTAATLGDGDRDLIDCAYIESRGDPKPDEGYGEDADTIVDCSNLDEL